MAHVVTAPKLYGLMAEFETPDQLLEAARRTRDAGYKKFDCYTPFPIHGLTAAMGVKEAKVPWTVFIMGLLGAIGAFSLQVWTSAVDYPLNVGGRDLISWPYFIPVTFEGHGVGGVVRCVLRHAHLQPHVDLLSSRVQCAAVRPRQHGSLLRVHREQRPEVQSRRGVPIPAVAEPD
jgi:hypothetical protein